MELGNHYFCFFLFRYMKMIQCGLVKCMRNTFSAFVSLTKASPTLRGSAGQAWTVRLSGVEAISICL
jgi:hypothetical protein